MLKISLQGTIPTLRDGDVSLIAVGLTSLLSVNLLGSEVLKFCRS